jgi:nitrate/nitrite-specific signal transduction histidine kinase
LQGAEWHCLPLVFKSYLSGILIFTVSEGQKISNQQIKTLGEFGPKIALTLENNYLQNKVQTQTDASITERNRIAQDLHDTLGQNLSYLRLKLDQMSEHHSLISIGELESSIEGMRDIANEAYLQMRATLADLHSSANVELTRAVKTHADKIAERANFQVEIINHGEAVPLPPHVKRQILYICREALNNVEKHANAHLVKINLRWDEENLSLSIKDDGCGLKPRDVCDDNHLGMAIMSERASDINAQLSFDSQDGQGLRVSLIVPLSTSLIRQ